MVATHQKILTYQRGLEYATYILWRGIRPLRMACPGMWRKIASGSETPFVELWRMWNTFLLPLLPSPLISRVTLPVRDPSMSNKFDSKLFELDRNIWKHIRWSLNKFPDFFVWALLLIVHTWNSSPLPRNLLRLKFTCCTVPTTSGTPYGSPLVWACQWPSSQPLSSPQLSHNDSLWA